MKKIAFVFPDLLPMPAVKGGATETLIQLLIDANEKRQECVFHIYCMYDAQAEQAAKDYRFTKFFYIRKQDDFWGKLRFLWFRVKRKFSPNYVTDPYLIDMVKAMRETYDAVIVESCLPYVPYLKKKGKTPTLLHLHFDVLGSAFKSVDTGLAHCDGIICVSQFLAGGLKGMYQGPVAVLPNVVDTALFTREKNLAKAEALAQRLGVTERDKVILYAGRLAKVKGVSELVEAFRLAVAKNSDLKLLLVGSAGYGETVQDEYYSALLEQIGDMLGNRVFMTGYVPHDQMPAYYAMADVAVMPTVGVEEAFGLSALEPMAMECHFVGSDSGGIPEVAVCPAAVIVPRGEDFVPRLGEAIYQCIKVPRPTPELGRNHVLEHYDAQGYYDNFLRCLQEFV